ncbi:MAG TPA: protein kinase [Polyangiaceae bacterium]|nr:protein kinase [Polyangiaceae bacterium]
MKRQPDLPASGRLAGPGRVLLVDDQPKLLRLFERSLTKAGHEVVTAENGRSAVELVRTQDFDVVVSDVRMPDMGGVELLRELHERDPDLPVLLVSGSPDLQTALKAVEYGAFEYLTKPVPFDKLEASVVRAVACRRSKAEASQMLEEYRSSERRITPSRQREAPESWTGEYLGGRYRIGRLLGTGGMGSVYAATREDLGRMRVAIKILHPQLAADEGLIARFRREAETVGAINHPNIVRILDFQIDDGNEPAFLVMELLDGLSLRQELQRRGWLMTERSIFIAHQMLAALAAVHRAGVIHRDIKPENVFLTSMSGLGDIVKLLDFGVAKVQTAQTLTQTGAVVGTPMYMAPEQARGERLDARCDLYSVGAILYEMLSAQAPFAGDNYNALLFAIQQGQPTPLTELRDDIADDLRAVIERSMARDIEQRFRTAEEMSQALAPWLSVASASTPPESSAAVFAPTMVPPSKS